MLYKYRMKLLLWRRTTRPDEKGCTMLSLRITLAGERSEFQTDVFIPAAYWPKGAKEIQLPKQKSLRWPEFPASWVDETNANLAELKGAAKRVHDSLPLKDRTARAIQQGLRGVPLTPVAPREVLTLAALGELFLVAEQSLPEQVRKAKSTLDHYKSRFKTITNYLRHGIKDNSCPAVRVDMPWVRRFERWCLHNGHGVASMHKQVNMLQLIISFGAHEGLLPADTIRGYKYQVKAMPTVPVFLPAAEHALLQEARFANYALERAIHAWLFCAETGLSWVDYCRFAKEPHRFIFLEDGEYWIRMVRQKMKKRKPEGFSVPFFPAARLLYESYNHRLPYTVLVNANKLLHKAEVALKLSVSLTTKLARATFSQRKRDEGYSGEAVASMMGDTEQVMNEHYSRISEQRIRLEMERVRTLRPVLPLYKTGTDN